jgi:2-C-methyl-D-erythritol 2,4-cyclodiphosphate synthase
MESTIAQALKVDADAINIKATTTEKLGFEGREEGISVQAIVLIEKCN